MVVERSAFGLETVHSAAPGLWNLPLNVLCVRRWLGLSLIGCVGLLSGEALADAGAGRQHSPPQQEEEAQETEAQEQAEEAPAEEAQEEEETAVAPEPEPPPPPPPALVPDQQIDRRQGLQPSVPVGARPGVISERTRVETNDGVTVLSNRGDEPEQAADDPAPPSQPAAQQDSPTNPTADEPPDDHEATALGKTAYEDTAGSLVDRPNKSSRTKKEKEDEGSFGGWLWLLLVAAAALLVPIAMLLNRGARNSSAPPSRHR